MSSATERVKPKKPSTSFPLTPHNNGQWCKKIRGQLHFFGVWADPQGALDSYLKVAADLHAGRQPRLTTLSGNELMVKDVCNHYLTAQLRKVDAGEIGARWFEDCRRVIIDYAGNAGKTRLVSDLTPSDFLGYRQRLLRRGMAKKSCGLGVHALNRAITVIKSMFTYAYEMDLIDRPMKYGNAFGKASKTIIRKNRNRREIEDGKRLFTPENVIALLEAAEMPLKAMIFLGINGGFGNTDCSSLPVRVVSFSDSIIDFPRPKTGIGRTIPMWEETHDALCDALAMRPKPADPVLDQLFFLTRFGRPWVRQTTHRGEGESIDKVTYQDAIKQEFDRLLGKLGLKRRGIGFYTLRHTFRTWADEASDQHAVHRIMGHVIPGMAGEYVEKIELTRLRAVVDHVRSKLGHFGKLRSR